MSSEEWYAPYVAGLVDNHAGLVVTVGKQSARRIGYRISAECRIKLSDTGPRDLLTDFLQSHDIAYRTTGDSGNEYESYEIVISRRTDLQAFLRQIHPYLVARQEAAQTLSETIIPRLERGDHSEKESFLDLMSDVESFRMEVGRANRAKYDLEYFRTEWDTEY